MLNFDVKQQEIRLYQDGVYLYTDSTKSDNTYHDDSLGLIAIGRTFTNRLLGWASVEVDELLLYNQLLPETKIKMLSQQKGSCVQ